MIKYSGNIKSSESMKPTGLMDKGQESFYRVSPWDPTTRVSATNIRYYHYYYYWHFLVVC